MHLYAFQFFYFFFYFSIWEFARLWLPATETYSSAKDSTAASVNLPSWVGTALVLLFSWTHAHLRRGQQGWVDLREIRAWLRVPGQPWGSCCGRSRRGNKYPRLHSIVLCHGSAAKDRVLFPSSPPLLPLRWLQMRPLLAARSPYSSPGPSHSSGTEHPAD